MKKILVSDYDKTFYLNDEDIEKNKNEIKKFRNTGNLFIIATGRSFQDFKNVKDFYNIEYDYVILNHGATVLDSRDNVIYNYVIDNSIIKNLRQDLQLNTTKENFCCSIFESRVDIDYSNLTKIHVNYNNNEIATKINNKLDKKYANYINKYFVKDNAIEIISSKTDKSSAIKLLIQDLLLNENNVWTIGDGYSDIEMIKNFNGCCMKQSVSELKELTTNVFNSVSELVIKLMEGNKHGSIDVEDIDNLHKI